MRLSARGRLEADALARYLAHRPIAAVYSSPMLRARTTARVILAAHRELARVHIDANLQEVKTGWQGQPVTALESINWDFYTHPLSPDDDSIASIQTRMLRWLKRILRRHPGREVVGVSHGDPILILVGTLRGLPLEGAHLFPRPYIHTGALFRLEFDRTGTCQSVTLMPRDLDAEAAPPREVAA